MTSHFNQNVRYRDRKDVKKDWYKLNVKYIIDTELIVVVRHSFYTIECMKNAGSMLMQ